jgi:hypothetical protein
MDTSKLQIQAEDYIKSKLLKHDFWVSKPQYDELGGDLHILDDVNRPTRLLRIQCKGRTLITSTNLRIPKHYLSDNFILFLYLEDKDKNENLYIFFPEEILEFSATKTTYNLYCSHTNFRSKYAKSIFTNDKAIDLRIRLKSAKIKEETTVLIDSFCFENALKGTLNVYEEIYPDRQLSLPNTLEVIKQVLKCYDRSKSENRIINVYLFLTPYNFIETKFYDSDDLYAGNNKIRLFEMRIDGLISFEIEDFLHRIISSENIILLASDIKYIPLLQELKNENKDVMLVCEKLNNGLRNFGFHWGDIAYPIAFSLGLTSGEI